MAIYSRIVECHGPHSVVVHVGGQYTRIPIKVVFFFCQAALDAYGQMCDKEGQLSRAISPWVLLRLSIVHRWQAGTQPIIYLA